MCTLYPKETLISLANSEKHKLQYLARTYGTPCKTEIAGIIFHSIKFTKLSLALSQICRAYLDENNAEVCMRTYLQYNFSLPSFVISAAEMVLAWDNR
jgi:hypothetical protein